MDQKSKNGQEKRPDNDRLVLEMADIISILGDDYRNIYCVDRETYNIEIYRYENDTVGVREVLKENRPYNRAIQMYIEENVFKDDKEKMKVAMDLDNVCSRLQQVPHFSVHYRVKRNSEILFYRMKCARIRSADSLQKIIFAFACEDADVRWNRLGTELQSGALSRKRKILIAEDNALNLEMLCALLKDEYEIITANNGKIALEVLEDHYKDLSLILLDIQMPVLDGFEVLKKVREDAMLSSVPIIVLTTSDGIHTELASLDLGAADFIAKPYNADLIRRRIRNIIGLKESSLTLAALEHDALTGFYTEQAFFHYAKQLMAGRPDKKMHLLVAKIKDFKLINSIYGAKRADELLLYLTAIYSERLKNGLIARTGNSSFAFLFYDGNELDYRTVTDTIHYVIENTPIPGIKVKYGIYEDIDKHFSISTICDYALMAAETVMDNYDCDLAYYTKEIAQKQIYNQMIENSFEDALHNEEFIVYYQPKVDIITEKVLGAEALVRWKKRDGSVISPGDFIPVYEKDGLIEKLDEYVFEQVCRLQKSKKDIGKALLPISVNLSRSSILQEGVAERYIEIAKKNEVPFSCVPLELTESVAVYSDKISKTIDQLIKAGFKLQVDDFGSGYSSLAILNQLPFSTLKIDKSLINHVCEEKGRTLVEQVILLSKVLKMQVVAEGVETKEQLEELRNLQCDEIQGFYFARPMPEKDFIEYIESLGT